ncbi:MAG: hypothetical protein LC637_13245, partial [Xanthomonadaceae bacterium]|nr:hypothetical protein [Xanthomonadaceae bacterium]
DAFSEGAADYLLWQRAFRTLTALADAHGLSWRPACGPDCEVDDSDRLVTHAAGAWTGPDTVTEHFDPDVGLIAWSVAMDGRLNHLYPLDATTARKQRAVLQQQHSSIQQPGSMLVNPDTQTLDNPVECP